MFFYKDFRQSYTVHVALDRCNILIKMILIDFNFTLDNLFVILRCTRSLFIITPVCDKQGF